MALCLNIWLESCCMIHSALFSFQRTISLYLSEHFEVLFDSACISYRTRSTLSRTFLKFLTLCNEQVALSSQQFVLFADDLYYITRIRRRCQHLFSHFFCIFPSTTSWYPLLSSKVINALVHSQDIKQLNLHLQVWHERNF